jgi:hypothetical protein
VGVPNLSRSQGPLLPPIQRSATLREQPRCPVVAMTVTCPCPPISTYPVLAKRKARPAGLLRKYGHSDAGKSGINDQTGLSVAQSSNKLPLFPGLAVVDQTFAVKDASVNRRPRIAEHSGSRPPRTRHLCIRSLIFPGIRHIVSSQIALPSPSGCGWMGSGAPDDSGKVSAIASASSEAPKECQP